MAVLVITGTEVVRTVTNAPVVTGDTDTARIAHAVYTAAREG